VNQEYERFKGKTVLIMGKKSNTNGKEGGRSERRSDAKSTNPTLKNSTENVRAQTSHDNNWGITEEREKEEEESKKHQKNTMLQ